MRAFLLVMLSAISASSTSCATSSDQPWVELRGQRFIVEIADDDASRTRGLMFRTELAPDRGMLFIFEREQVQAFWMRNTYIPLDILYFDNQRRLVSMSQRTPPCRSQQCPNYPSKGPARFTLEIASGRASELGVKAGDELVFGPTIVN
jgi:uncharacterized membrane protein (UPF0127 family)